MVAPLAIQIGVNPRDAVAGLTYGIDKVRFIAPVPASAPALGSPSGFRLLSGKFSGRLSFRFCIASRKSGG
jgi:hypothetical protein